MSYETGIKILKERLKHSQAVCNDKIYNMFVIEDKFDYWAIVGCFKEICSSAGWPDNTSYTGIAPKNRTAIVVCFNGQSFSIFTLDNLKSINYHWMMDITPTMIEEMERLLSI